MEVYKNRFYVTLARITTERFRQTGCRKIFILRTHRQLLSTNFQKALLQVMRVPESYPASLCRLQLARRFISRILILFSLEDRRKVKIGSTNPSFVHFPFWQKKSQVFRTTSSIKLRLASAMWSYVIKNNSKQIIDNTIINQRNFLLKNYLYW